MEHAVSLFVMLSYIIKDPDPLICYLSVSCTTKCCVFISVRSPDNSTFTNFVYNIDNCVIDNVQRVTDVVYASIVD